MRKPFNTPIEETTSQAFKAACKDKGISMNEALEALMQGFTGGKISIEVKTEYIIRTEEGKENA